MVLLAATVFIFFNFNFFSELCPIPVLTKQIFTTQPNNLTFTFVRENIFFFVFSVFCEHQSNGYNFRFSSFHVFFCEK